MENQNPQDVAQSQQIPHIAVPIPPKKRKTWVIVVMILIGLAVLCCAIFGALILFVFNTVSKGADEAKSITSACLSGFIFHWNFTILPHFRRTIFSK